MCVRVCMYTYLDTYDNTHTANFYFFVLPSFDDGISKIIYKQCSKFIKIAPEKDFYAAFGDSPAAEPLIKKHGLHNHTSNDPPTPES